MPSQLLQGVSGENIKTNIHETMDELGVIALFCWKLPPSICGRDIVVTPTRGGEADGRQILRELGEDPTYPLTLLTVLLIFD
jgi:hypothetical protein